MQESAQILLAGGRKVVERLEVMSGPTGRRSWPEAIKARIVAESFERGARVVDVARRHEVAPQQVDVVPRHGFETALCAGYAANLTVAASVSRPS